MCSFGLFGQLDQTLGLFRNEPGSFNGYTMFTGGSGTYLVDNCGELVHKWQSEIIVTGGFYLLDDGSLLRSVDSDAAVGFNSGGRAGAVEMTSWDGDQLWYFQYAETESHMSHHDVEPLPNGNILILAWSYKTNEEVVQAGRDGNVTSGALWPTMIIEVEPIFPSSGNIVWEWHLWDHLIQDLDASKDNFGVLAKSMLLTTVLPQRKLLVILVEFMAKEETFCIVGGTLNHTEWEPRMTNNSLVSTM